MGVGAYDIARICCRSSRRNRVPHTFKAVSDICVQVSKLIIIFFVKIHGKLLHFLAIFCEVIFVICLSDFFSPNSPKPSISGDTDAISKHRLTPITAILKHYNTQKYRFPVLVLLKYSL